MKNMLLCSDIVKSYTTQVVLNGLNLAVKEGSVTFLLGLNGAGKTTLLKMISGLLYPDAGHIARKDTNIASLLDSPKFYENLTAYNNLRYQAIIQGISPSCIDDAMHVVRLEPSNRKPVKHFSLGMKQRLGIARAILGSCNLIMLDEPFSGLDPAGIEEIRELIINLNQKQGKTLLISSHLISETHDLATDYAILHGGKIATRFSSLTADNVCRRIVITTSNENYNLCIDLLDKNKDAIFWTEKDKTFCIYSRETISGQLESLLPQLNTVGMLNIEQCTLKEFFLALTERGRDHVAYC